MSIETAEQIEDQAARWVARMDGDAWTADAAAELDAWLAVDRRREGALLQAQAALALLTATKATPTAAMWNRRGFFLGGGAALAASVAGVGILLSGTTYETDVGEIRRVPLADGSTAAINTQSVVTIDMRRQLRRVTLRQGEAWFQVAKDSTRPFLVEAGRVRVQAIGTAFSVRRIDGGAEILVTEGVIEAWADGASGHKIRVAAGGSAFVGDDAAIERSPGLVPDVDKALAWRSGKIDLVGQPLSEAIDEFNRYNRRQLVLADAALRSERFDGVFRTDDPAGFAAMIHTSLEVPVDLSSPDRIVIGRTPS